MPSSVFCLAVDHRAAVALIEALRLAGLRGSDASVVFTLRDDSAPTRSPIPASPAAGSSGGVPPGDALGTAMEWLMGMGTVSIPGLGPVTAAGPLLAILSGPANGILGSGLAGALIGHGVPDVVAHRYEQKLRDGQVLISVHAMDGTEVEVVRRVMEQHRTEHILAAPDAKQAAIAASISTEHQRSAWESALSPGQEQLQSSSQR